MHAVPGWRNTNSAFGHLELALRDLHASTPNHPAHHELQTTTMEFAAELSATIPQATEHITRAIIATYDRDTEARHNHIDRALHIAYQWHIHGKDTTHGHQILPTV